MITNFPKTKALKILRNDRGRYHNYVSLLPDSLKKWRLDFIPVPSRQKVNLRDPLPLTTTKIIEPRVNRKYKRNRERYDFASARVYLRIAQIGYKWIKTRLPTFTNSKMLCFFPFQPFSCLHPKVSFASQHVSFRHVLFIRP